MAEDKIKYSDLIEDDGALVKLIQQLNDVNTTYADAINAIQQSASKLANSLKNASGATKDERSEIDAATTAAERLDKAIVNLNVALSNNGQALAIVKNATSQVNKEAVNHANYIAKADGSYDKMNLQLKQLIGQYKALGNAQRNNSTEVAELLNKIIQLSKELAKMDAAIKNAVTTGKQLATTNIAVAGSYESLMQKYNEAVAKLKQIPKVINGTTDAFDKQKMRVIALQNELEEFDRLMTKGGSNKYRKSWDGLGFSISQVVRELPSATIDMRTFFLAISNNIPIVVDEIKDLRLANQAAVAAGGKAKSIIGQIGKALLSWHTLLIVGITLLTAYGDEIAAWVKGLFGAKKEVISTMKALRNLQEAAKKQSDEFGEQIALIKRLQAEWKTLSSGTQKLEFIKREKEAFEDLGVAVNNVADAQNLLVTQTKNFIKASSLRAMALAAEKKASETYATALEDRAAIYRLEAEKTELEENPQAMTPTKKALMTKAKIMHVLSRGVTPIRSTNKDVTAEIDRQINKHKENIEVIEQTGDVYANLFVQLETEATSLFKSAGIESAINANGKKLKDATDKVNRLLLSVNKKYQKSQTDLETDELKKRSTEQKNAYAQNIKELLNYQRQLQHILDNQGTIYKNLTNEQVEAINKALKKLKSTWSNVTQFNDENIRQLNLDTNIRDQQKIKTENQYQLEFTEDAEKQYELQLSILNTELKIVKLQNEKLPEGQRINNDLIEAYYNRKKKILKIDKDIADAETVKSNLQYRLESTEDAEKQYNLQLDILDTELKIVELQNEKLPKGQRINNDLIEAYYKHAKKILEVTKLIGDQEKKNAKELSEWDNKNFKVKRSSRQQEIHDLQRSNKELDNQIALWNLQINSAKSLGLSDNEVNTLKNNVANANNQKSANTKIIEEKSKFGYRLGQYGLGGTLLEYLGADDAQIATFNVATDMVMNNISEMIDGFAELAEAAVEAAEARVDAAKEAYDAEVEARNNGYANSVAAAKKELDLEKKNQAQKEKMLEKAKKAQLAVDTAMQVSSLITASANIWSSLSGIPIIGPGLAIAMLTTMWASFAAAKATAVVMAQKTDEYGEGGLEFLEGGSHASGNDIDLGVNNRRRRRMRAEGGEALAIINKKRTRKYRKILPDVVDSLNKGVFEDKYMNAFANPSGADISIVSNDIDLSRIEDDIKAIRKQNEIKYYSTPNGLVMQYKNVKRTIKH